MIKFKDLNFTVGFLAVIKSLAFLLLYQSADLNLSFTVLEISWAETAYASFSVYFFLDVPRNFDRYWKYVSMLFCWVYQKMFKYQWARGVWSTSPIFDNRQKVFSW